MEALLITLPLLGALTNGAIGLYALRLRAVPAARSFALVVFIVTGWGIAYALEIAAPTLAAKVFWLKLRWPVFYAGMVWLLMALQLTGREKLLKRWHIVLLCIVPTVAALAQINTEQTGLVRRALHLQTVGEVSLLSWTPGPLYLAHIGQTYLLMLATLVALLSALPRASSVLRRQVLLVAAGTVIVLIADPIALSGHSPIPGFNFTWVALDIYGVLTGLALFRYGMFSVVPIAMRLIVESMPSIVVVLDPEHRVLYANKAALRASGLTEAEITGRRTTSLPAPWDGVARDYGDVEEGSVQVALERGGLRRWYDMTLTPLLDRDGRHLARLVALHDVTELRAAKDAAEEALARVRVLSGLLPICASCKSIRNDEGYWQAVEQYVAEHTGVEFTHGFCPDCSARIAADARARIAAARTAEVPPHAASTNLTAGSLPAADKEAHNR